MRESCCLGGTSKVWWWLSTDSDSGRNGKRGQTWLIPSPTFLPSGNKKIVLASKDCNRPHCPCQHVLGKYPWKENPTRVHWISLLIRWLLIMRVAMTRPSFFVNYQYRGNTSCPGPRMEVPLHIRPCLAKSSSWHQVISQDASTLFFPPQKVTALKYSSSPDPVFQSVYIVKISLVSTHGSNRTSIR